ncbi:MAG: TetR/AcrR family transcriptional regulator [Bacteroidota bacterium]
MKKTRENILTTSRSLFNEHGVADVSLRRIARELGISHSNLIYYFKTKNELIEQLHLDILARAKSENEQLQAVDNRIAGLRRTMLSGFQVLYDYRFFMLDLPYIMKENATLHQFFMEVEKLRADMYVREIQFWIEKGWMRQEAYQGEYSQLIERIRIFSDFWLSSLQIYHKGEPQDMINKQVDLFMSMFFPYLTAEGRNKYLDDNKL